jgi:hypothetical protein
MHFTVPAIFSLFCRSLLAGDSADHPVPFVPDRLQAGSYLPTKPVQASGSRLRCE